MTQRIRRLRDELLDGIPEICPERAVIFTESMRKSEGQPIVKRRAEAFYDVLDKMSLFTRDGDLLVGNQARSLRAAPVFPEYSVEWIVKEFEGDPYHFAERPTDKFQYTDETKQQILEVIDYWRGKTLFHNFRKLLPDEVNQAWDLGIIDCTWVSAAGLGNIVPDYEKLLKNGLEANIKRAKEIMASLDLAEPDQIKKYWFLEAVVKTNEAVINFAHRFAAKLDKMAEQEQDAKRKQELLTMAANCRRVPEKPATSFWEALQFVWFIHLAIQIETNGHAISLGRFDQFLWPYYQHDIANGIITKEQALELTEAFFIKCNEVNKLRSWNDTEYFPGYHMAENLAIGGQTSDGLDAANEFTYLVLDATENLRLPKPSVSIKWFEGTSDEFMDRALEVVQKHTGGQPAFYNDLGVMRMLKNMGIKNEDLYNWVPDGCIEASIPGKWDFAAKGPWLNVAKVFELTINNGKDPKTGITFLPGDGDLSTFADIHQLVRAFKKQLHYFMRLQVIAEHINDEMHKLHDINAFRSSLIEDCIGRGLSLIEGGSIYSADGGPTVGTITAADSLAAIETAVFKEKWLKGEQLLHALQTDFQDQTTSPTGEEIRQMLLNRAPKFGNDDDRADKWAYELMDYIGSTYHRDFKNSRYGKGPIPGTYAFSQSSVTGNVPFGKFVGATPDGRLAGTPLNNGISPSNGAEQNGLTATINSVSKMPSIWFQKGAIFNVRLTPDTLLTEQGRQRVLSLIKVLFRNYQYHIQFNVLGTETLREAQAHPEEYRDLMVRVAGYSAFYTPLSRELQEDIIKRMAFEVS